MKQIIAAAATVIVLTAAAFAGQAEGKVESVDPASGTITLDNGASYVVSGDVTIDNLAPGDSVMVTFEDGSNTATAVEKM